MHFEAHLREIPQSYWDRMQLDFISCFHHTRAIPQTLAIPGKQADLHWTELTLNRTQVLRAWRRKPTWRRLMNLVRRKERISYYDRHRSSGAPAAGDEPF